MLTRPTPDKSQSDGIVRMSLRKVYLANLDPEFFPQRCLRLLRRMGWNAAGNRYCRNLSV